MLLISSHLLFGSYDSSYLQSVGHRQTHEAGVQALLTSHSKHSSKQHDAVPNELNTHPEPPGGQRQSRDTVNETYKRT